MDVPSDADDLSDQDDQDFDVEVDPEDVKSTLISLAKGSKDKPKLKKPKANVRQVFEHLIAQWDIPSFSNDEKARTVASASAKEIKGWGIKLDKDDQKGVDKSSRYFRIDLQGMFTESGVRYANVQGQWSKDSVFQVSVRAGIQVGASVIQGGMTDSLKRTEKVKVPSS